MELILSRSLSNQKKYSFIFFIFVVSFLISVLNIYGSSAVLSLPLFYIAFMCGYFAIASYSVGLILGTFLIQGNFEVILVACVSFFALMLCQYVSQIKASAIPYILTLIAGIYYAYSQDELLIVLMMTLLTYTNIHILSTLPPVFMHSSTHLLTHERMKSLSFLIFACILALLPYSKESVFIFIRLFILVMVYHQFLDDVLPALFYISLFMLLMNPGYKDDLLAIIIPMFFFYMFPLRSKYALVCLYFLSHILLPFFIPFSYDYHGVIIVLSGLIFLILPIRLKRDVLTEELRDTTIKNQLTAQVASFCQLFEQMTTLFNQTPVHNYKLEYIGFIYEDLCQDCPSSSTCFHKQYGVNRLVKLMNKGLKSGYNKEDMDFINQYCIKPLQYVDVVGQYKKDFVLLSRRQDEYQTMKKDLYHQFSLLNDVLSRFSNKLQSGNIEEKHILEHMLGYNFDIVHLRKYYESQSTYYIEVGIVAATKQEIINEFIPILESYLNESVEIETIRAPMHHIGYTYVVLKHQSRYYLQYGVSQCAKDLSANGDSYIIFHLQENQYFALSDGMGVGVNAHDDSALTLNVVKQLMSNGISLRDTLHSVNALLKIKNQSDMFTTLDMIEISLVMGTATFIKYGATPTYIIRDSHIIEINSQSLPIGIVTPIDISIKKEKLVENDILVMITDGFTGDFGEFLKDNLYMIKDEHPKDIANVLMHLSSNKDNSDDMSIIVLKLCKQ